jgi:hypothetical protein
MIDDVPEGKGKKVKKKGTKQSKADRKTDIASTGKHRKNKQ